MSNKIKAAPGEGHLLTDLVRAVVGGTFFATTAAITQPLLELGSDFGKLQETWKPERVHEPVKRTKTLPQRSKVSVPTPG